MCKPDGGLRRGWRAPTWAATSSPPLMDRRYAAPLDALAGAGIVAPDLRRRSPRRWGPPIWTCVWTRTGRPRARSARPRYWPAPAKSSRETSRSFIPLGPWQGRGPSPDQVSQAVTTPMQADGHAGSLFGRARHRDSPRGNGLQRECPVGIRRGAEERGGRRRPESRGGRTGTFRIDERLPRRQGDRRSPPGCPGLGDPGAIPRARPAAAAVPGDSPHRPRRGHVTPSRAVQRASRRAGFPGGTRSTQATIPGSPAAAPALPSLVRGRQKCRSSP
jgi:hypothetical protein